VWAFKVPGYRPTNMARTMVALLFVMILPFIFGMEDNHDHEGHVEMMLDPFDRVKELLKIHTTGLTLANLNTLIHKLSSRIHCTTPTSPSGGQHCHDSFVSTFYFYSV
jgi:hypothetical protein